MNAKWNIFVRGDNVADEQVKLYYVRLDFLAGEFNYLNFNKDTLEFTLGSKEQVTNIQTQFEEQELTTINNEPNMVNIDITKFKVKV